MREREERRDMVFLELYLWNLISFKKFKYIFYLHKTCLICLFFTCCLKKKEQNKHIYLICIGNHSISYPSEAEGPDSDCKNVFLIYKGFQISLSTVIEVTTAFSKCYLQVPAPALPGITSFCSPDDYHFSKCGFSSTWMPFYPLPKFNGTPLSFRRFLLEVLGSHKGFWHLVPQANCHPSYTWQAKCHAYQLALITNYNQSWL